MFTSFIPRLEATKSNQILRIEIKRGVGQRYPKNNILRRLLLEFWFFFYTLINIRELRASDAIIVILPPSCFVLATFLVGSNSKIIGVIHDLQAIHLNTQGSILKKFLLKLIKAVEISAFKKCDKLVIFHKNEKGATLEYKLDESKSEIVYPQLP